MAAQPGTLEILSREIALALAPLEERLQNDGALQLMADLGLRFPPALLATAGVAPAISAISTAAGELPDLVTDLVDAIMDEDETAIIASGVALLVKISEVIVAIDQLSSAIHDAAGGFGGLGTTQVEDFASELPGRLLELLVVDYLEARSAGMAASLELLGLIERAPQPGSLVNAAEPPYIRKALRLDLLGDLMQDPQEYARQIYQWGEDSFGPIFLGTLYRILDEMDVTAHLIDGPGGFPVLEIYYLTLQVDTTTVPPGMLITLHFPATRSATVDVPLSGGWAMRLVADASFEAGMQATITPPSDFILTHAGGTVDVSMTAGLTGERPDNPYILIGQAGGSRLEVGRFAFSLGFNASWDVGAGEARGEPLLNGEIANGKLVVDSSGGGGVLSVLLSNLRVDAPFDMRFTWSPSDGAHFEGSVALDIRQPVSLTLGPLNVQTIYVKAGIDASGQIPIELSGAMNLALGPLIASVDRLGLTATLSFPEGDGNLGPLNLEIGFKPPTGIGLQVDASVITGGGFLSIDPGPPERYAGALALKLTNFAVVAFGMFERTPSGKIAFVMVLGIRFFPGLQIGFGFAITGIGGMVGLNRRADVDALRSRLVSGGASNVLFCEDPISNAPTLFGDLAAIFPVAAGIFIVGPTLQIGWLVFVRFDLGIIIELPGPSKIVILGSARFQVGGQAGSPAVVQIRLDILGIIDFARKLVSFDAALVDSKLLQIFTLTGTAAFRLSTGDSPYVLLTIGGFHPSFNPEPAVVPQQTRVGMTYDTGGSTRLWVRLETYLAITTNTFQLGASLEAGVEIGPMNANGYLKFDALIQFTPFYFDVQFSAGFRVRYKSHTLAGITFNGSLTGPGPIVLSGKLCIEILFFDICFSATFTLGESAASSLEAISSLVIALEPELEKSDNLEAVGSEDRQVALAPGTDVAKPVVSPLGRLQWTQKRAPFNVLIERMEGVPLASVQAAIVTSPARQGAVQDWFSPGTFQNLSESESVNLPPFQRLESGILLGFDFQTSGTVVHTVEFETYRLPEEFSFLFVLALPPDLLLAAALGRRAPGRVPEVAPIIGVSDETWTVRNVTGGVAHEGLSPADAHMRARGTGAMALPAIDASETIDLGGI
jgi:hypothetical protein